MCQALELCAKDMRVTQSLPRGSFLSVDRVLRKDGGGGKLSYLNKWLFSHQVM